MYIVYIQEIHHTNVMSVPKDLVIHQIFKDKRIHTGNNTPYKCDVDGKAFIYQIFTDIREYTQGINHSNVMFVAKVLTIHQHSKHI